MPRIIARLTIPEAGVGLRISGAAPGDIYVGHRSVLQNGRGLESRPVLPNTGDDAELPVENTPQACNVNIGEETLFGLRPGATV